MGSGRCCLARSASASCIFCRFAHITELACYAGSAVSAVARQRGGLVRSSCRPGVMSESQSTAPSHPARARCQRFTCRLSPVYNRSLLAPPAPPPPHPIKATQTCQLDVSRERAPHCHCPAPSLASPFGHVEPPSPRAPRSARARPYGKVPPPRRTTTRPHRTGTAHGRRPPPPPLPHHVCFRRHQSSLTEVNRFLG